ncbi:Serine acetyltransferase 5, partial [Mucuna pruriens]
SEEQKRSEHNLVYHTLLFHDFLNHTNPNTTNHRTMPTGLPAANSSVAPEDEGWVWAQIKAEARRDAESEPALASYLYSTILSHSSLERSLSFHLGNKLCSSTLLSTLLYDLFLNAFSSDPSLRSAAVADLRAARERDPACVSYSHCLLNYKGFLACQVQFLFSRVFNSSILGFFAHRVAHLLWRQSRRPLALALHSRIADVFAVDIHPAARIGKGILFDHATGVVVGETAVIGNNVSILHHVTLGGTGKVGGDRHPKIGDGVLIGAGATILGNIKIGEGAKVGAGSVVLIDVPPQTTAVGNPARLVGGKEKPSKHEDVPGESMDHTSFISE